MKLTRRSTALTYLALFSILVSFCALPAAWAQTGAKAKAGDTARFEALSAYAQDMTKAARGAQAGADDYGAGVRRALRVLSRSRRNNPLLVTDDAASGRTVVEALARRVVAGDVSATLRGKRIFRLDAGRLLAEAGNGDEFGRRFAAVLQDARGARGSVVLFLENLDGLLSARDAQQAQAALDSLAGEVAHGTVRLIGTVTPAAFELKLARNEALKSQLQELYLDRPEQASGDSDEDETESADVDERGGASFTGDRIAPDLREALATGASGAERVPVILQAEDLKSAPLQEFLKASGARVGGSYAGLGAQLIEVPLASVGRLAEQRGVSYISLDRGMGALASVGHIAKTTGTAEIENDSFVSPTTGLVETRKLDGKNIGIAILDSGIYAAHKAFLGRDGKSRIVFSKDFTGEGRTDDPYGHGTHVAGLAAGNGQIADGLYAGVAPDANIINLRVLNVRGQGTTSRLLNALNWLVVNRTTYNIRVVNMSLGAAAIDSYRNDPVCRAVRKLVDAGVVVVAAAGNDGKDAAGRKVYGQIHAPGDEPSAITVGATNTFGTDTRADDGVATYSSRGPTRGSWTDASAVRHYDNLIKPDIVAPGNKLISAEATSNMLVQQLPSLDKHVSASPDSDMMSLSGTSMATPIVAGAAALLLQVNPKLTPNMIKALMMTTAQPLRGFNSFEQGAGQLNVAGAVTVAKIVRTDLSAATPVGTPVFTKLPPLPFTTIAGYTFPWSMGIIVGQTFAVGPGLALYQKVYGLGALLGDGITISDGVIMSDRAAWSSSVLLGDNILTSNGSMMSDGVPFCGAGVLAGDGVLLGDKALFGDGVIMADGSIMADGTLFGDSTAAMLSGDPTPSMVAVKDNGLLNLLY
ncbi:MAG: serine protease AprX [Acidobacteriota bacterium]|jgi:subtilisin family serine protease|nr:serine protease AprX [Acidobacteriota bacterium]